MLTFISKRDHPLQGIRVLDNINELLEFLNNLTEICIDIETNSLDPLVAQIYLVSIGNEERQYVIDALSIDISFINQYSHCLFIGHNIKYDYTVLKQNGVRLKYVYDTLIVEQRLGMGSGRRNALDKVILRRLGITTRTDKETTRDSFIHCNGIYNNDQIIYSGEDVEHLSKIKRIQEPLIIRYNMEFLVYGIEFPFIPILGDCELNGLDLDREKWIEIIKEKEQEERDLNKQLYESLKPLNIDADLERVFQKPVKRKSLGLWSRKLSINFNSSSQLKAIFKILNLELPKGTKRTKDGQFEETETVGVKNLQLYLKQYPDTPLKDFIDIYIKYKKVQKHLTSFGYNYLDMISPVTNRIHTVYRQASTETGRLSSGDTKRNKPNFQQIPKLKKLRHCFKRLGYKILTIDLSSAEMVLLGSFAQDFKLIELNEGDIHSYLATKAWRRILNDPEYVVSKEINEEKRTEFKNVVYGTTYGAGARKIAETMNISIDQAETVLQVLREELPLTFEYLDRVAAFGTKNGYIIFNNRTNSRRWFPEVKSGKRLTTSEKSKIERACKNSPIQGTQSDMVKEATVQIMKYIETTQRDALFLMNTHDEWVFAFKGSDDFATDVQMIINTTCNLYLEGVEMKSSYHIEDTWTK